MSAYPLPLSRLPLVVRCCICGRPVTLENAKTDSAGRPCHEACYVASVVVGKEPYQRR
jgi:hypothetical protein